MLDGKISKVERIVELVSNSGKKEQFRVGDTVDAGYEILDPLNGEEILKKIERVARVCYKSEDKITEGSAEKMVRALIKSNHMAMLEHYSFSVKFICDRGVSHEIVRHRVASYAQESTRYCNYNKSGDVAFIRPVFFADDTPEMDNWVDSCMRAEKTYNYLISEGRTPQEARSVLPNSLKTEVVMTANLREWRYFLSLRACGSTGKPHPQMLEVAVPLLKELREREYLWYLMIWSLWSGKQLNKGRG